MGLRNVCPTAYYVTNFFRDSARGARYLVRHGTRLRREAVTLGPGVANFVRLADTVVTATEKTKRVLLPGNPDFDYPATVLGVYAAMLGERETVARGRLFVRLHYRLIEAVLRRCGVENLFISEHEINAAYDILRRRHRKLFASLRPLGEEAMPEQALRFWVASAVALGARHPLREIDLPRATGPRIALLEQAPSTYCLLIVALTGAILTAQHPLSDEFQAGEDSLDSYIDSAIAVVTARFDLLAAQLIKSNALELLSEAFASVLPFLP